MWFDYKLSGDDATVWISPMDGSSVNQFSGTNTTYKKIYDHLKNEYSGGNVTDTYTLTDGSTVTITYKLASDGHKICTPGQITNLGKIYDDPSIGTAWYYVLNTTGSASNGLAATSFMLPRTKFGFHGAGGYAKIPIAVSSNVQTNLTEKEMFLYFYTGTEDNSLTDLSKGRLINITTPSGNTRTRTVEVNVADNLKSGAGTAAMPIVGMSDNNSFVGKNLGFLLDHDAANNTIKVKSNFTGDASFVGVSNGQLVAADPPSNKLSILDIYPVGSVYISVYGQFDPNVSFGGTWERFGSGRCLWGAKLDNSDLGVTISAGLPTIPNHSHDLIIGSVMPASSSQSGAALHGKPNTCNCYSSTKSSITQSADIIYGKSSTVQPPAIGVIFWKRIN